MTVILYYFIGSEAGFIVMVLFVVWKTQTNLQIKQNLRVIVKFGVPIAVMISLIFMWAQYIPGGTMVAEWLNDISSGRFQLSIEAMNRYPLTFLGAATEFGHISNGLMETSYVYADNAYVYMLINSGIIYLLILGIVFMRSAEKMDSKSVAVSLVYLCYGLAESDILSFTCLFPVLVAVNSMEKSRLKIRFN